LESANACTLGQALGGEHLLVVLRAGRKAHSAKESSHVRELTVVVDRSILAGALGVCALGRVPTTLCASFPADEIEPVRQRSAFDKARHQPRSACHDALVSKYARRLHAIRSGN
jgi:hypothetical protein